MFKKLSLWFFKATHKQSELAELGEDWMIQYGKPDLAEITRKQVRFFDVPINLNNKTDEERRAFYKECDVLSKNDVLQFVMNSVVEGAKEYLLLAAQGDSELNFKRGEVAGVYGVKDKLKTYAVQAKEQVEEFDEHDIV